MAEKQKRRSSLTKLFKSLRITFKVPRLKGRFGGSSSVDSTSTMQTKSASRVIREDSGISSIGTKTSRLLSKVPIIHRRPSYKSEETEQNEHDTKTTLFLSRVPVTQNRSLSYYPETEKQIEQNKNSPGSCQEKKTHRIRRFTTHLNTHLSFPRSQTTLALNRRSLYGLSRIPPPTEPPKGALYSHLVSQREERRTTPSSLGRRIVKTTGEGGNIHKNLERNETRRSATATEDDSKSQRQSPPSIVIRRHTRPCKDYKTSAEEKAQPATRIREARPEHESNSESQFPLPRYYQTKKPLFCQIITPEISTDKMSSPQKRIRVTKCCEDLKTTQEAQRMKTRLPILKQKLKPSPTKSDVWRRNSVAQTQDQVNQNYGQPQLQPHPESDVNANISRVAREIASKLPPVSSTRRKIQIEKMVSVPTDPVSNLSRIPYRSSHPRSIKERQVLIGHVTSLAQVETAMPEGYWLGRFMTLTNAFHHEDSFGEPDISTNFEMPSSYSRPFQGGDDGDNAGCRVKRAFMVLENLCVTEEASASLREFRDAYTRRFGDRWMA